MNILLIDWNSFWINILAGSFFFILSLFFSILLIPKYTVRLIKNKNKKYLAIKIGSVLQELCNFIAESPYRDKVLNFQEIAIFTKKKDIKNYRFISLCNINVLNPIVHPKIAIVISENFENKSLNDLYKLFCEEYDRLKIFRLEIERILSAHSLHIDDEIIQKISILCFEIKTFETKFKTNLVYNELLETSGSERNGVFGRLEILEIYEKMLLLIKELICLDFFEYEITKQNG